MSTEAVQLSKAAAFITRDCLIDPLMPPTDEEEAQTVPFVEGALAALKALRGDGFELIFVVNVPAIAKGAITPGRVAAIHSVLIRRLAEEEIEVACFLHCPHLPDDGCQCRLPRDGLLQRIGKRSKIDLKLSIYVTHDRELFKLESTDIVDRYLLPDSKHPWVGFDVAPMPS